MTRLRVRRNNCLNSELNLYSFHFLRLTKVGFSFPAVFLSLTAVVNANEVDDFRWPNGAVAAVSLAYDDALDSQLDHAIPDLDEHGLKGSFYLTLSSDSLENRLEEWRAVAERGHELGNHALFHACSKSGPNREWVAPSNDLDQMPAEAMVQRVRLANVMLSALDGRTKRTFTPPCGDREAGGIDYVNHVKPKFVATKVIGELPITDMHSLDLHAVPVHVPIGVDGASLIALVEEAGELGTMVNFTFHGIGGDHLPVSREAHAELLQFLADNQDRFWTDTFINIMKHVSVQQSVPES